MCPVSSYVHVAPFVVKLYDLTYLVHVFFTADVNIYSVYLDLLLCIYKRATAPQVRRQFCPNELHCRVGVRLET